jgi:organic hydroperoxide reductase OsmC/OhrA
MADHHASLRWKRSSPDFTYNSYNRAHDVVFKDGKVVVPFSAAVAYKGDADRVDPEDAFVGSLSSCHMLTFLFICSQKKLVVDTYEDDAVGTLEKGPNGKLWMAHVTLKPRAKFAAGVTVDKATLDEIHHRAHEDCFIAISVKTEVSVEPQY